MVSRAKKTALASRSDWHGVGLGRGSVRLPGSVIARVTVVFGAGMGDIVVGGVLVGVLVGGVTVNVTSRVVEVEVLVVGVLRVVVGERFLAAPGGDAAPIPWCSS